jgi:plastocyanin
MELGTGRRICLLFGVAAALVLAPASAVAEAPPLTGTINAVDFAFENPATGQSKVVIAPGGTVQFAYPSGASAHNVNFAGATPSACTQTAGSNSGGVPPLPAVPTAAGWAGSCSFASEGTYAFACQLHPEMKGSVVVAATAPPAEAPGGGGGGSAGGPQGGGSAGAGGGGDGPAASGLQVPRKQPGPSVRGSIRVARDGSQLRVALFARRSALGGKGAKEVKVGHLAKPVAAGRRPFAVKLSAPAVAALAGGGSLPVKVRVTVDPASGTNFVVGTMATIG